MRIAALVFTVVMFLASSVSAHDLTDVQKAPWTALEEQVGLWFKQDWEEHRKYLHPKAVDGGEFFPVPAQYSDKVEEYFKAFAKADEKVLAHLLVPSVVVVADDVAIIDANLHVLTKPDGKLKETIYRLHNTWKKHEGRWKLLATCNSIVATGANDDD